MKKIYYILTLLLCVYVQSANAQMGVNSTGAAPATSSILDVSSTTKGFLMPRMTTAQRNAIPFPATGLMIFNTTTAEIEVQRGLGWVAASRMAVPFSVTGAINGSSLSSGVINAFNSGTGPAVSGQTLGVGIGAGFFEGGPGNGVFGKSNSANGVYAESISGSGIYAGNNSSTNATGLFVNSNSLGTSGRFEGTNGSGVFSVMTGTGFGIVSQTNSGTAGDFNSTSGTAVNAFTTSGIAVSAGNSSASAPVGQFVNLSGGTALSAIAITALDIAGGIKVSGAASTRAAFKITTNTGGGGNTTANVLTIPNTTLANNINDILIVTHNYSPNNTYLNKAYGVFWSAITNTWNIYLEDISTMPNNISFNVLVIKQ